MKYFRNDDYEYLKNKHHDTAKPYNRFYRFVTHEEIFDEGTGLSPEAVLEGISENDKKYENFPHSVRKARAFEYILDNTKISCDKRDIFPAICSTDRPIAKMLINKWHAEVVQEIIPETWAKRCQLDSNGLVSIRYDYAHSVPNWEEIFRFGFKGLLKRALERKAEINPKTEHQQAFFDSIEIEYRAIIRFLYRLADIADENPKLKDGLLFIAENPPKTFYHCLLVNYLYFMFLEHIEDMQARSIGNFDRILYPYYKNDIENGVSKDELKSDLAYFLMQFAAIDNYWGQPVYFGGKKQDGRTEINELSYDFLDVYDDLGIFNPKLQIKLSDNTPKEFVLKALDMIRRGHNSIVFVCEETIAKSLISQGATPEEARLCVLRGCYEYSVQDSFPTALVYLNLMKPFEYAMRGGKDGVTGEKVALETPTEFDSFDDFYKTYLKQLAFCMESVFDIVDEMIKYNEHINPQPLLSAATPSAMKKGIDVFENGATKLETEILAGFIANVADSLTAIKELVFDKKEYTIAEFTEILDKNFEGYEELRMRMLNHMEHYGNNYDTPDSFAVCITDYIVNYIADRKNIHGYNWGVGFHVARMSYIQGEKTAASPDGRLFGEELSKNVSPSMGRNTKGPTAAILSATKLKASTFTSDACLDLGVHPSAVKGDDGLTALYAMLMTFMNRGGHAMHINIFDAETLRKAQENPENYKDLQIRVCGWNVLFNDIDKPEQDEFIRQAESLV